MNFLKWLFNGFNPYSRAQLDLVHERLAQATAENVDLKAKLAVLTLQAKDLQVRLDQREAEAKKLTDLVTELSKRPAVWAKVV